MVGSYTFVNSKKLQTILLFASMVCVGGLRMSQESHDILTRENREKTTTEIWNKISSSSNALRNVLESDIRQKGIKDSGLAIVSAMTLGDKSHLSKETRDTFSKTGASHALALSGMHLSIIFAFLLAITFWLPKRIIVLPSLILELYVSWRFSIKDNHGHIPHWILWFSRINLSEIILRRTMILFAILSVWIYVFFVGMPISVVRSATMLSIASFSVIFWREKDLLRSLSMTAIIMLMVSPLSLFDIAFQLSFLAVLGIALIFTRLYRIVFKITDYFHKWHLSLLGKVVSAVWACISVSIAAQCFTIPLVIFYFHNIACYGLLTSLVVTLSVYLIILLSIFLFLIPQSFITDVIANWLNNIIDIQDSTLNWIASLPYSTISNIHISLAQTILIYIIILLILQLYRILRKG